MLLSPPLIGGLGPHHAVAPTGVPMPSASNRPQFTAGINLLAWSGPVGGGASNGTYTPQTRTLTNSGSVTSSHPNQVIQGLNITGTGGLDSGIITINHNNVTVQQCHVLESTTAQANKYSIWVNTGVTGTIIEDCFLDGNARDGAGNTALCSGFNTAATGVTMRRNTCQRSEQALRYTLNNCNFTENWCTLIGGVDADWVEVYPNGGSCSNILIQYNVFDGTDNTAGGADSGINLTTGSGLPVGNITNVTCDTNWFTNWPTVHAIVCDNSSGGTLSFSMTNSGFFNYFDNISPLDGIKTADSGNYNMATATSLTGTPYHGTGIV